MGKSVLAVFAAMVLVGVSLQGQSQIAVVPIGEDLFIISGKCSDPCEECKVPQGAQVVDSANARVIIATDMAGIGGITASDPDDIQSFVHLLTFADKVVIEGITTSPPRAISVSNNSDSIARLTDIIAAYGSDRQNLINNYGGDFPTVDYLNSVVKGGSVEYHSIDDTNLEANNDAVRHIIERARCGWHNGDKRPLYLLSWGSSNDFAQAIFNAPDIKKVVRLVAYSRTNNGDFESIQGATNNSLSCRKHSPRVPKFEQSCDAWKYLRLQTDLWWVDYTGGTRVTNLCDTNTINIIRSGGALGAKIIDNFEPPHDEECVPNYGGTLTTSDWLKMGDTWTLMFTHNSPSQRDNPLSNLTFGQYYQPNTNRPYWQLRSEEFKGRASIHTEWRDRAKKL